MSLRLNSIRKAFVTEFRGIELTGKVDRRVAAALRDAVATYAVVVIRDQDIDYESFLRFAGTFGTSGRCGDITNLNDDGSIRAPTSLDARQASGNALWHTDMPVLAVPPLAAMLLAREVPSTGGETQFADLAAALQALSPEMRRRLRKLRAVHELETIRRRMGLTDPLEIKSEYPPAEHPVVCLDPFSGRPSMLVGAHTSYFRGMSHEASGALLDELLRHSTREEFVYTHKWRRFDLLMWNNRRVLHRVLHYDAAADRRRLWRAEVVGGRRPKQWPQSVRELLACF